MEKAIAALVTLLVVSNAIAGAPVHAAGPSVIIVGAGMSGISAAKTLSDAGVTDILILEATDRIGGRIHKTNFGGVNVEIGANWVEGVNGPQVNPIWTMADKLSLRNFLSDYSNLSSNIYKQKGGLYSSSQVEKVMEESQKVHSLAESFSKYLPRSGHEDISILTHQRLHNSVPVTPLEMAVDYFLYDYKFAEPPRVTSLQNTALLPTYVHFGNDVYFVADQRGYETVVYDLAGQFLETNASGSIIDSRLQLEKVVRQIQHSESRVIITAEDGSTYKADYVLISVSIGVLQTKLIKFEPDLPQWKILAIHQFDMTVYTKIFLKFPYKFWPEENRTDFFLYASDRRGYYPVWQHFSKQYPESNILQVSITDEESRRIEQQPDAQTKVEVMEVLRDMFGENIPEATDILIPRWWSDRFFKGSFSNWPLGVTRYEHNQIRAPFGNVYFTGEHTSPHYNGYVHGAYLAGIHSANVMVERIDQEQFMEL